MGWIQLTEPCHLAHSAVCGSQTGPTCDMQYMPAVALQVACSAWGQSGAHAACDTCGNPKLMLHIMPVPNWSVCWIWCVGLVCKPRLVCAPHPGHGTCWDWCPCFRHWTSVTAIQMLQKSDVLQFPSASRLPSKYPYLLFFLRGICRRLRNCKEGRMLLWMTVQKETSGD